MLYYLADIYVDSFSALNVLRYFTVRAAGAAMTAFLVSLLIGPSLIRQLRALKIGQFIREEHVQDLHKLHKDKAGTPTMGGALILISSSIAIAFWGRFENRLLLVAIAVFVSLGLLGALDDYIKLRRKQNEGLSARAKLLGQFLVGLLLGAYLYAYPITTTVTYLSQRHVNDWPAFMSALQEADRSPEESASRVYLDLMPDSMRVMIRDQELGLEVEPRVRARVLEAFRTVIERPDLYERYAWEEKVAITGETQSLIALGKGGRTHEDTLRMNRLLLEATFPDLIFQSRANLHTSIEIPGLKFVFIPLGIAYILFVLFTILAMSNAVNLADGLDGLAIGASVVSLLTYTGIAYIVSRVDWSQYLYLVHVPEASELTVFGATLLGAGLGFLWFNSHPAEVFMGDTGSLALGGAIGTMAILTKQELLLVIVGGLFVIEASSVVLQVASVKLTGKRVFRMAPIHHHFELLGWSETKVTIRFWIIAIVFALMSLATLKLR
jgi:UDP-N-acetylmuramyl pentapeptide phosphotransferase/UDP-N-acetylglucosamine-1-phosphate transferase